MTKTRYELDFELCRDILLWLEAHLDSPDEAELVFEGHTQDNVFYNAKKLHNAGLILVSVSNRQGRRLPAHWPMEFTELGEKFLEATKDQDRWDKAVQVANQDIRYETLNELKRALFNQT